METFIFYRDQKVSIWERVYFSVEAEDFDAAKKLAAGTLEYLDDTESISINEAEMLFETQEPLPLFKNSNLATVEIYNDVNGEMLVDNSPVDAG